MQVRIGVIYSPKEIEVEVEDEDGDELVQHVEKALGDGAAVLWLTDRRGRRVGVVADKMAYVEIGSEMGDRRVGFSAL
ncbi:MAG TPA: DUF3107 domain-containing protein [Acidimicrobiales bacterium]|nr:DUF3107 domain-containing protein [Acidimicrobiales bacterium]